MTDVDQSVQVMDKMSCSDSDEENVGDNNSEVLRPEKKRRKQLKKGIIYLSTIPPFMNVTKISEIMSQFGELGRIFLQPSKSKRPGKPAKHFTEGWVEFLSKRVAKEVAANLNNKTIGGKKKSRYYDYIWNMKYLPRFKWVHLNERLEYERAVTKQKLRAEIEQAKRETSHFANALDLSEKLKRSRKVPKLEVSGESTVKPNTFKQRKTDEEIKSKKKQDNQVDRKDFLKNLFQK